MIQRGYDGEDDNEFYDSGVSIEQQIRRGGDYTVGLNGVAVINNTFDKDFYIAELFGVESIKETYKRAFFGWKHDIRYLTALALTMNDRGWRWHKKCDELADLYFGFWRELDQYILDGEEDESGEDYNYKNFTSNEVSYFIRAVD